MTTLDVAAIVSRMGAPVRMVPRRILLERLLEGFPAERIRCNAQVVGVANGSHGVRLDFADGSCADGDLVIGADGLHSKIREIVGAPHAEPTGWCSWQGLAALPGGADRHVAFVIVGEHGNLGLWPAGDTEVQWWFDLPWSPDFVRPDRPIEVIRANFTGWSELVDQVLATLTDDDLARSPYPHFRHPLPGPGDGALTLLGDAAHTMPPTLAQGTNQALLDTMVLCKAVSDFQHGAHGDLSGALRWYENTRRRRVAAVSRVASLQVSHGEAVLRPAAMVPNRTMTWVLATFLRVVSHRRMAAEIDRDLAAATITGRDEHAR